jgi:hypothetical protein
MIVFFSHSTAPELIQFANAQSVSLSRWLGGLRGILI